MIRSFLTVYSGTLTSRLLVFARDAMIAALLGTGAVADAFLVAFQLVNVVLGLLMPFVIAVLAPGFTGRETLQFAVDDARLMLPYLAFAGPVTVMLALASAQSRFVLTAFSPVLFNIALIAVMVALILIPHDAAMAALVLAATVGVAGFLQLLILAQRRRGEAMATP